VNIFLAIQLLCAKLKEAGIEYMLSGSVALNAYTTPRMTRDVDIVIILSADQITVFLEKLEGDFFCDEIGIREEVRRKGIFNIIHKKTATRVDFIVKKENPFSNTEFQRRKRTTHLGFPVWVVSPEDLFISKLKWTQQLQSNQQLLDLESLKAVEMDWDYIQHWIKTLNLNDHGLLHSP
jgi:hypothetical protein